MKDKKISLIINGIQINAKDFDIMRRIIMEQNIPEYKEEYGNPELEAEIAKADKMRNGNRKSCSLEKQIVAVAIGTSMSIDMIKDMTIRKFLILLEMIDKKLHYNMLKTASLSGMVTFKSPIVHYLMEDESNTIDNKVLDYNALKKKIEG